MHTLKIGAVAGGLLLSIACSAETSRPAASPPAAIASAVPPHSLDTASSPQPASDSQPTRLPDKASASRPALPSKYTLTDTTVWYTMLEDGHRAILRRGGVMIDTVDLAFDVAEVGTDSLVFLPVHTDTIPIRTSDPPWFESFPTEHVFWTLSSRRKLHDLLPFFDDYFSVPDITGSVIHYWGVARRDSSNRLYAMRYNFRTAHLDSLFMNREDPLATDYRYYLGTPQDYGREVSFHGVVLDSATWRVIRRDSVPN